jgi:hypothetical protein
MSSTRRETSSISRRSSAPPVTLQAAIRTTGPGATGGGRATPTQPGQCFWWSGSTLGGHLEDGKKYYAWIFLTGTDGSSPGGTTFPLAEAFYTPDIPGAQAGICTCYAQAHRADPATRWRSSRRTGTTRTSGCRSSRGHSRARPAGGIAVDRPPARIGASPRLGQAVGRHRDTGARQRAATRRLWPSVPFGKHCGSARLAGGGAGHKGRESKGRAWTIHRPGRP